MIGAKPIIGAEFRYVGTTHPWAKGLKVRVTAIYRGGDDGLMLRHDSQLGDGLQDGDVVEFQPWLDSLERWSWVTSDAWPADLEPL